MNDPSRKTLVDKLIDAYIGWRETCILVTDAYRAWTDATGRDAALLYHRYVVALEQEARTAEVYAGLIRQADSRAAPAARRSAPTTHPRIHKPHAKAPHAHQARQQDP